MFARLEVWKFIHVCIILDAVFILQIERVILQNEDIFQMTIIRSMQCNNCFPVPIGGNTTTFYHLGLV